VILARLLFPEDYGIIALVAVFLTVAQLIVHGGLTTALVQKKEIEATDYSSAWYFSIALASILYLLIYVSAPFISRFYDMPLLQIIFRIAALGLFPATIIAIQRAVLSRAMQFHTVFVSSIAANIISGGIGIILAYQGFGVWSLVAQQLASQFITVIVLWMMVPWRPSLQFSWRSVSTLFRFGWKLSLSSLINTLYGNLRSLLIGRFYTPQILGYYNRGEHIPRLTISAIDGSVQSVMFPLLAAHQDDREQIRAMVRRSITMSTFVIFPAMVGLAVIAKPLVLILLTEKWLPIVPFLRMFCVSYALYPLHTANLQTINALGRSDLFLKLSILRIGIGLSILFASLPFGVYAIAFTQIISGVIASIIHSTPQKKLIDYGYLDQLRDILPNLGISLLMGALIFTLGIIIPSPVLSLCIQIPLGIATYIGLARLFRIENLSYLLRIMQRNQR
jgi:O-antigen/teichoic acid export membrane protein